MASQILSLLSIVLCAAAHVHSMPVTCRIQGALIERVHDLLQSMGGHFPQKCLDHNVQLPFPASAFMLNSTAQVNVGLEKTIHQVLRNIDTLFGNDNLPNTWHQRKVDDFQNILYRLVDESECVLNKSQTIEDDFPDRKNILDAYFEELTDLLQLKDFSACAWEVVRKENLRTLGFILQNVADHLFWAKRRGPVRRG